MNYDGYFRGKTVLVTGGSAGIGKAIARTFAELGAHVAICGVNRTAGRDTAAELARLGGECTYFLADFTKKGIPAKAVATTITRFGAIDVLVNNAKLAQRVSLFDETEDSWESSMAVTLRAAFFTSQAAIAHMAKHGGGAIINIGSVEGYSVGHDSAVYHIAKAGMLQMTRYLAVHAGRAGVRVNCIMPGFIVKDEYTVRYESPQNEKFRRTVEFAHPVGHTGKTQDVAQLAAYLASPNAAFITGQGITVDGGLTLHDQNTLIQNFAHLHGRSDT